MRLGDPALARIARMNMFLHGDGGSKIFQLDSLDKNITVEEDADSLELRSEKKRNFEMQFPGVTAISTCANQSAVCCGV